MAAVVRAGGEHGVEGDEELARDGDEGGFDGLACALQAGAELLEGRASA